MEQGGNIVDYHGCDFFPERWFDRVVVLQTENSVLYDRLTKRQLILGVYDQLFKLFLLSYSFKFSRIDFFGRGYTGAKLTKNIECEIFQVLLEEAKESYPEDIVSALKSDTIEDITRNIATLTDWVRNWQPRSQRVQWVVNVSCYTFKIKEKHNSCKHALQHLYNPNVLHLLACSSLEFDLLSSWLNLFLYMYVRLELPFAVAM